MLIIFEFSGGPFDGETVECETTKATGHEAALLYYSLCGDGTVGAQFMTTSPAAVESLQTVGVEVTQGRGFHYHKYEVTDRLESDDEVLVRVKYIGLVE